MQSTQQTFFIDLAQALAFELRTVISLYTRLNFRVIYIYTIYTYYQLSCSYFKLQEKSLLFNGLRYILPDHFFNQTVSLKSIYICIFSKKFIVGGSFWEKIYIRL